MTTKYCLSLKLAPVCCTAMVWKAFNDNNHCGAVLKTSVRNSIALSLRHYTAMCHNTKTMSFIVLNYHVQDILNMDWTTTAVFLLFRRILILSKKSLKMHSQCHSAMTMIYSINNCMFLSSPFCNLLTLLWLYPVVLLLCCTPSIQI